ncbi:DUF6193 family natural product biosynthesis protein [Streptomyces sp. S.PB5]|uniref:DUF6193 family natural product biosynthesis protein n=1 Tax=Streptomyces sp. S.PB5 TaxID=3020844 RepID=UPI0025AFE6F5|nr:DUF6193 family natural product biosynthesis protein [Streptomyces sp. S.PB5]MDN3025084.1 DUF6193 family natural product biosynthesis protein [Streptomyces sp. S.PB5]
MAAVVEGAGLVRHIERIAREQGVELGVIRTVSGHDPGAEIDAERGRASVHPRAEGQFQVRLWVHTLFVGSEGWSTDLGAVVTVVDLWRRGARLRELHERFPFMSWSALAQGFEDGEPAAAKWRELLASDWHLRDRPLLRAGHAHPELRAFYPDMSHGSLMLCRRPFDLESGLAKIMPFAPDHYRVTMLPAGLRREVTSLDEALELAARWFRETQTPPSR